MAHCTLSARVFQCVLFSTGKLHQTADDKVRLGDHRHDKSNSREYQGQQNHQFLLQGGGHVQVCHQNSAEADGKIDNAAAKPMKGASGGPAVVLQ